MYKRPLERLHLQALLNGRGFNKAKCPFLHLGHNNPIQCSRLGEEGLGSCSVEKDLKVLTDGQEHEQLAPRQPGRPAASWPAPAIVRQHGRGRR